jgi:thiamine pyrophosphate-dependent acetolactate synthase large subunit-like protein
MVEAHLKQFPDGWGKSSEMRYVQIPPPRYADIASAFDHWATKVEDAGSLRTALEAAIAQVSGGRSALVDVPTAPGKRKGRHQLAK